VNVISITEEAGDIIRVDSTGSSLDGQVPSPSAQNMFVSPDVHADRRIPRFEVGVGVHVEPVQDWTDPASVADQKPYVEPTWSCGAVCQDMAECPSSCKWSCCCFWGFSTVLMVIILIACSIETIDSTEMGIAYNAPQAKLSSEVQEEGLHGKAPFGYFVLWPRTQQTLKQNVTGLSSDGVVVSTDVAFQYTVESNYLLELTMDYKDFDNYGKIMQLMARSGIRNAIHKYTAQQFQTMRAAVQTTMFDDVTARFQLGNMHAIVMDLQLTFVSRPALYDAVVDEKENARNAIDLVSNLRQQQITQANTQLLRTRVQANKTIDIATTQAAVIAKNAQVEGDVVYGRYASQGVLYKQVRSERNLTSEGLLAYIGTRLVDELANLTIGVEEPARVAFGTNLNATE